MKKMSSRNSRRISQELENVRVLRAVSTSSARTDNNSNIVQIGASNRVHHFLIGLFAHTGDETKPNKYSISGLQIICTLDRI